MRILLFLLFVLEASVVRAEDTKNAPSKETWGAIYKRQIEKCWNVKVHSESHVSIEVRYRRNGKLAAKPRFDEGDEALAAAAISAIENCQPVKLPAGLYGEWKRLYVDFR